MKFIDCSASVGYGAINRLIVNHENYIVTEKVKEAKNAEELLKEMDFCGIDQAVVYHQSIQDVSVPFGNAATLKETQKSGGRLIPSMSILPSITNEEYSVAAVEKYIRENGIFGVRIYPQTHRYMADRITLGDILEYLTEIKMPVYVSPEAGWEWIFALMKEFPNLTAILTNYGLWGSDFYVYPLVNAYKNFHVDTSDFQEIRGIEYFVKKFGDERMLFGTNFPMDNAGGPIATLLGANISKASKEKIASGNIERLMSEVKR